MSDETITNKKHVGDWAPCHVGRAIAVRNAFAPLATLDDVYGSDVYGHQQLLVKREREQAAAKASTSTEET